MSQGFQVPPFPLPMRAALAAWKGVSRLGIGVPRFDEAKMIAEARKNTGLHDFGDDDFVEPMRRLFHAFEYEDDGSVRIVVAHEDPGVPNWINTVGHARGTMCFRWIRAKEHPQPQTRVVKFSDIPGRA